MKGKLRDRLNIRKATGFSVAINALQILAMGAVFLYVLISRSAFLSHRAEVILLAFCLLIVVWGAIMDIRDAFITRKIAEQTLMIEEAYRQLEELNGTLRSQRHDFMNHLQVVFSLTEMKEYDEAMHYIERIYGDIQRLGSVLKTAIPAVNALLSAKNADCSEHGIRFEADIQSAWSDIPVSGWEMCRVFGNLIDNARDAILESGHISGSFIRISLAETPSVYAFSVSNNGPSIPEHNLPSLFQLGFTTKSDGHGSGLNIVSEIMKSYNGNISVHSDETLTVFSGTIPKPSRPIQSEDIRSV